MPDSPHTPVLPPSRLWRACRFFLAAATALVVVAIVLGLYENWRGRRNWEAFRAEWQAKGEVFDFAALVPPPPPAEQNFAATPLLAPLLDYRRPLNLPVQWNNPQGNSHARALGDVFKSPTRKKTPQ